MPDVELPKKIDESKVYSPKDKDKEVLDFVSNRVLKLKEHRAGLKIHNGVRIEQILKDADKEYQPHELNLEGRVKLVSDEDTGLRSRVVKVGLEEFWQSNISSPDLYVKVNTALSILLDQNPEAVFLPDSKKYEANTKLAYGNWKHSWEISGAKQQLKNFVFNQAKYGVGFMRTFPKKLEMKKRIRKEFYPDQPEKDVYEKKTIVKFDDLCRDSLNPLDVWVNETARPGDPFSIQDWYFEKGFSLDQFRAQFGNYKNHVFVKPIISEDNNGETIRLGFYENDVLDIFAIIEPESKILLYHSPLPNDDGMLSLTLAPWTLRDDKTIYGIGLYEIIKSDSILYDRLLNMGMDQLTLSIYKMFFYKGTDVLGENGKLIVTAGEGKQVSDPNAVKFLEFPGPGLEFWKGLEYLQERKDNLSGVTPQLSAKFSGKTLGQDLQSKEAALERMKTPLDFILDALQMEGYITLSWQKQILSTPEILEYTSPELLRASLLEWGLSDEDAQRYLEQLEKPTDNQELLFDEEASEEGQQPRRFANVFREVPFNLEKNEQGEMVESNEQRFYRFGLDLPLKRLEWRGIIRILPQSILVPSKEAMRRSTLAMYNLVIPTIQGMLQAPQSIPALLLPLKQIVKVYEQDTSDWVDEKFFNALYEASKQPPPAPPAEPPKLNFSVKFETLPPEIQQQVLEKYAGLGVAQAENQPQEEAPPELFVDKLKPLVPENQLNNPTNSFNLR